MSKVAMLIEKGYQEAEALVPYYRLLEAGYEVDVVGSESGVVYLSKQGYPLKSDLAADEAQAKTTLDLLSRAVERLILCAPSRVWYG